MQIAQRAVLWTFRDSTLADFLSSRGLTPEKFPFTSYRQFLQGFVDDLSIFSAKSIPNAEEVHCLAIEAKVSTFMNPKFIFLGLFWNLDEEYSIVQNDRVSSILSHRVPRNLSELASRLATL